MEFNLSEQIARRNKSLAKTVNKRKTGAYSFENATIWINAVKQQLKELHFQRLIEEKQKNAA